MSRITRVAALLLILVAASVPPVATADAHAACDVSGVRVSDLTPSGRTRDTRPDVQATVHAPCGLDTLKITFRLDGERVPFTVTNGRVLTFAPDAPLQPGPHVARVRVEDAHGNVTQTAWGFLVKPDGTPGERHVVTVPPVGDAGVSFLGIRDAALALDGAWVRPEKSAGDVTVTVQRLRTLPPDVNAPPADPVIVLDVGARARLGSVDDPHVTFGAGVTGITLRASVPLHVLDTERASPAQAQVLAFTHGEWRVAARADPTTNGTHAAFNATLTAPGPVAIVLDTQNPGVRALAPASGAHASSPPVIRARVTDNVGLALAQVVVNGDIATTRRADLDSLIEQPTETLGLEDGWHTVVVRAEDASGNEARATWTFVLDRVPPTFPRIFAGHAQEREVRFEVSYVDALSGVDPRTVRLELDGRDVTPLARVSADAVTFTPSKALAPGEHTLRVVVSDRAGNAAETRHAFTLPAPTPAPALPLALLGLAGVALALTRGRDR